MLLRGAICWAPEVAKQLSQTDDAGYKAAALFAIFSDPAYRQPLSAAPS